MQVEMWVWQQGEQKQAATRAMLSEIEVSAVEKDDEIGGLLPVKVKLDTDEKIAAAFPNGRWHTATFREEILGEDSEKAAAKMWVGGEYKPWLYGKAWVLTMLKNWDFPEVPNMEGYGKLPRAVTIILENAVAQLRDTFDLPNSIAL